MCGFTQRCRAAPLTAKRFFCQRTSVAGRAAESRQQPCCQSQAAGGADVAPFNYPAVGDLGEDPIRHVLQPQHRRLLDI